MASRHLALDSRASGGRALPTPEHAPRLAPDPIVLDATLHLSAMAIAHAMKNDRAYAKDIQTLQALFTTHQ